LNKNENDMKKIILSFILALVAQFSFAAVSDSLKKDLVDYDYRVSFVEENYAPFEAIMQKGYKREYKALKKQLQPATSSISWHDCLPFHIYSPQNSDLATLQVGVLIYFSD